MTFQNTLMIEQKRALKKLYAALFYGVCSFMMVFINKYVLTSLKFPSFVVFALLQMIVTVICLYTASLFSLIKLPRLGFSVTRKIFPLPLLFFVSLVSGLGGTQKISLPMFTALRHTTIFITMILEYIVLRTTPLSSVRLSVFCIIFGSMLAAIYDLTFDSHGYILIFINNISGAFNGVFFKQKLNSKDFNSNSLLFYNALFMIPFGFTIAYWMDDFPKVVEYFQDTDSLYLILSSMALAFFFGLMLNYSMLLCTEYNSALTTTFVGATKNTAITYIGMFLAGDYVFHLLNFIGISLTVVGSTLYMYVTFTSRRSDSKIIEYHPRCVNRA